MDPVTGLVTLCLVKGRLIQPGADLRGADLAEVNLRRCDLRGARLGGANLRGAELDGANLAGADLHGACLIGASCQQCDLSNADLRNANLTRARLDHAAMGGARLEGARLFKAAINLTSGLKLAGAQRHPFFQDDSETTLGNLRFLDFEEDDQTGQGWPHDLTPSPGGRLSWLKGEEPYLRQMGQSGVISFVTPFDNTRQYALHLDAQGRLWCAGDRATGYYLLREMEDYDFTRGITYHVADIPLAHAPRLITVVGDDLWATRPGKLMRLAIPGDGHFFAVNMDLGAFADGSEIWGFPRQSGKALILATSSPCGFWLCAGLTPGPGGRRVKLPKGCLPQWMAEGPDHSLWFTAKGVNGLGRLDLESGEYAILACEGMAAGLREPHRIAFARDGAVWFTSPKGHAIGRYTPEAGFEAFPLPSGSQPEEIVAGFDGRMYFTLAGKARLGSIWSLPGPGEGKAAASSSSSTSVAPQTGAPGQGGQAPWVVPFYHPLPGRPKGLSRAERQKAHELKLERAQARFETLQGAEEAAVADARPAPPSGPVRPGDDERKEEAPALKEDTDPLERLEDLEVSLSPGAVRHILAGHGAKAPAHKSRFQPAFHTPEGLMELIASGLEQSGVVARILAVDAEGRNLTLCRAGEVVGWYQRHGQAVPTHSFLVVTSRWLGEDGHGGHDILAAYPVSDHWQ